MSRNWFAHCGESCREAVEAAIQITDPKARVAFVDEAQGLRTLVASMPGKRAHVVVGDGADLEPVNLAAALVADGHAREVVVATARVSGSLRARAARAGIARVVPLPVPKADVCATEPPDAPSSLEPVEPSEPCDSRETGREPANDGGPGSDGSRPASTGQWRVVEAEPAGERASEMPDAPAKDGEVPQEPVQTPEEPAPGQRLREGEGPCLVLGSARGGVGKSSIAAVMAVEAASWGMDVALLDLDLGFGNLYDFFGLDGPADLTSLAQGCDEERVRSLGRPAAERVTLYGPCERPEFAEVVAPQVTALISALKHDHDLVIVDGSTTWGDSLAQAAQACDRLLLVSDERAGAVGSLARASALAGRLGVAQARLVRVMNRCDPKRRDEDFVSRCAQGFENANTHRLLEGGFDVGELLGTGHAEELAALDEDFSRSCRSALAKVLADLGRLPDTREAKESRDLVVVKRGRLFRFAKEAV